MYPVFLPLLSKNSTIVFLKADPDMRDPSSYWELQKGQERLTATKLKSLIQTFIEDYRRRKIETLILKPEENTDIFILFLP